MRHVAESAKKTPVVHEMEVLVVGGGPGVLALPPSRCRKPARPALWTQRVRDELRRQGARLD